MGPDDQRHRDRARLRVVVTDERGRPVGMGNLARWLVEVAPPRARGRVGVAVVSDATLRGLNLRYRGRDYPTDVLAFPDADDARPRGRIGSTLPFLGDIVIARGVVRRQARAAGHARDTELRVLALHGLLHLLGYDHERDDGAMERVEARLRRKGGLREGLTERGRHGARASRAGVGPRARKK